MIKVTDKLKDLPEKAYAELDLRFVSYLESDLYSDVIEPTIEDYYEVYEVETGEIKECSSLWAYLNPRIYLDTKCENVLTDITSYQYFTVTPRSAWICLIKNNDILFDYEKKLLSHHLAEYPIYNDKLESWALTQ